MKYIVWIMLSLFGVVHCTNQVFASPAPKSDASTARVQALVKALKAKERAQAERILEREALVEREAYRRELQKLNIEKSVLSDVDKSVSADNPESSVE